MNYLSGECVEFSGDRAKTYVGVIVGNCAQELTSDVTGADGYTSEEEPYRLAPITSDSKFKETLWGLIDSISGSDNAISALGQGTVVYAFNRATTWSNEKTREGQGLDEKTSDDKQSDIAHVFHDEQYLIDKIDEEVRGRRNSKGDFNLASAGANAAAVLITLVPEGGAVVGSVLQAGLSLAQIIPADDAANPSVSATGLNASIIQAAINTGAIDESGLTDVPWYVPPKSGEAHGHINIKGTVKVDSEEISRAASFQGWVNTTSLIINNKLREEAQGS